MSKLQLTVIFQVEIVSLRRRRGDRSCSGRGLRGFGLRLLDEVGQLGLESPDFDGQNVGDFRTLRRLAETLQLVDVGASLEFIHEIYLINKITPTAGSREQIYTMIGAFKKVSNLSPKSMALAENG